MRARLGFLHVVSSQYDYKINLYSKYTIITGFSGRGKSTLVTLVAQALYEKSTSQDLENFVELQSTVAVGIIDESVANYKDLHNCSWFEAISNMFKPKMILLVDEDFSGLHNIEFQKALCDYDALYVIICRDGMNSLPYGVEDIYKMALSTAGNFHFNKPLYNKGDYDVPNEDESDFEDATKDTTMFSTSKYEATVEYLHSREFYEKNAPCYDYLVAWDDPVTQEYLKLSQELEEAKTSEEQENIVEKLMNLSWWKI